MVAVLPDSLDDEQRMREMMFHFGNVLAQSGAFGFSPQGEDEPEWLARQFAQRENLPLRLCLDAGILESNSLLATGDRPSLLAANRNLHAILQAKGYPVQYNEFSGGHDYIAWQGTLPDALQALLADFRTSS